VFAGPAAVVIVGRRVFVLPEWSCKPEDLWYVWGMAGVGHLFWLCMSTIRRQLSIQAGQSDEKQDSRRKRIWIVTAIICHFEIVLSELGSGS